MATTPAEQCGRQPSRRVLDYLGKCFATHRDVQFCLACLLPRPPAELLESGGAEAPADEERVEAALRFDQDRRMARENPVVVFITVQSRRRAQDMTQFFGGDDFFSRFFGGPAQPREQIQQGLGSGFPITRRRRDPDQQSRRGRCAADSRGVFQQRSQDLRG